MAKKKKEKKILHFSLAYTVPVNFDARIEVSNEEFEKIKNMNGKELYEYVRENVDTPDVSGEFGDPDFFDATSNYNENGKGIYVECYDKDGNYICDK